MKCESSATPVTVKIDEISLCHCSFMWEGEIEDEMKSGYLPIMLVLLFSEGGIIGYVVLLIITRCI